LKAARDRPLSRLATGPLLTCGTGLRIFFQIALLYEVIDACKLLTIMVGVVVAVLVEFAEVVGLSQFFKEEGFRASGLGRLNLSLIFSKISPLLNLRMVTLFFSYQERSSFYSEVFRNARSYTLKMA